jgi:hypothetical protein
MAEEHQHQQQRLVVGRRRRQRGRGNDNDDVDNHDDWVVEDDESYQQQESSKRLRMVSPEPILLHESSLCCGSNNSSIDDATTTLPIHRNSNIDDGDDDDDDVRISFFDNRSIHHQQHPPIRQRMMEAWIHIDRWKTSKDEYSLSSTSTSMDDLFLDAYDSLEQIYQWVSESAAATVVAVPSSYEQQQQQQQNSSSSSSSFSSSSMTADTMVNFLCTFLSTNGVFRLLDYLKALEDTPTLLVTSSSPPPPPEDDGDGDGDSIDLTLASIQRIGQIFAHCLYYSQQLHDDKELLDASTRIAQSIFSYNNDGSGLSLLLRFASPSKSSFLSSLTGRDDSCCTNKSQNQYQYHNTMRALWMTLNNLTLIDGCGDDESRLRAVVTTTMEWFEVEGYKNRETSSVAIQNSAPCDDRTKNLESPIKSNISDPSLMDQHSIALVPSHQQQLPPYSTIFGVLSSLLARDAPSTTTRRLSPTSLNGVDSAPSPITPESLTAPERIYIELNVVAKCSNFLHRTFGVGEMETSTASSSAVGSLFQRHNQKLLVSILDFYDQCTRKHIVCLDGAKDTKWYSADHQCDEWLILLCKAAIESLHHHHHQQQEQLLCKVGDSPSTISCSSRMKEKDGNNQNIDENIAAAADDDDDNTTCHFIIAETATAPLGSASDDAVQQQLHHKRICLHVYMILRKMTWRMPTGMPISRWSTTTTTTMNMALLRRTMGLLVPEAHFSIIEENLRQLKRCMTKRPTSMDRRLVQVNNNRQHNIVLNKTRTTIKILKHIALWLLLYHERRCRRRRNGTVEEAPSLPQNATKCVQQS